MKTEYTFVIVKPDGVQRRLIGEVISRFERAGMKIVALKMLKPSKEKTERHYCLEGLLATANRSIENRLARGYKIPYTPEDYAKKLQGILVKYLTAGPVVVMVLSAHRAVEIVRKLTGATEPLSAPAGTIRGDYSIDSYELADDDGRSIRNILHASGTIQEALKEISIWFTKAEIHKYKLPIDETIYGAWS